MFHSLNASLFVFLGVFPSILLPETLFSQVLPWTICKCHSFMSKATESQQYCKALTVIRSQLRAPPPSHPHQNILPFCFFQTYVVFDTCLDFCKLFIQLSDLNINCECLKVMSRILLDIIVILSFEILYLSTVDTPGGVSKEDTLCQGYSMGFWHLSAVLTTSVAASTIQHVKTIDDTLYHPLCGWK